MSTFSGIKPAPRDPILGLTEAFNEDTRPDKVNLGVGVYTDGSGRVPLLECVHRADQELLEQAEPTPYLPIDGLPAYREAILDLAVGDPASRDHFTVVQSVGGTGALRLGADLLGLVDPNATVLISNPSWANHREIFTRAGFAVESYPYYDAEARGVDVDGMIAALEAAAPGTIVVLHACCHNPTGYDLTSEQWERVLQVVGSRELVPVVDMAYQGFAEGLDQDAAVPRMFAAAGIEGLLATSFSKNLSLYGERAGSLIAMTGDAERAKAVQSQLKVLARANYSNPPTHGAKIAARVLTDTTLRALWAEELTGMRQRIKEMRTALQQGLSAAVPGVDMSHIVEQNGMFSYSGLSKEQMIALREEHGVYGLDSGRICVAALNPGNLDKVIGAIAAVC